MTWTRFVLGWFDYSLTSLSVLERISVLVSLFYVKGEEKRQRPAFGVRPTGVGRESAVTRLSVTNGR